jgi:hypothetical protein
MYILKGMTFLVLLQLILNAGISRQINKINQEVHLNRLNSIIFLYQMIDRYIFDYLDVTNDDTETKFIESVWHS